MTATLWNVVRAGSRKEFVFPNDVSFNTVKFNPYGHQRLFSLLLPPFSSIIGSG